MNLYIYFIFVIFNCALYLIINFYYINISIDERKFCSIITLANKLTRICLGSIWG